ncbi:MAG: hypothetical protein AC479_05145 [miscellaneous Crenarchaeota group-6 archaeon AD8-1]|nr:MAG: hypothetical protein AC479_05145 [miscellaneous Crenarchaeota group-6 archaeon AD8-1]
MTTTGEVPRTLSKEHFDFLNKQKEVNPRSMYKSPAVPLSYSKKRRERELAKIRQKYKYIRDVAKKEMEDLAKLAEMLPEKQYDQLFSNEVKEFTKLLKITLTTGSKKNDTNKLGTANISEHRRIIMLKLLDWLLWEIGDSANATTLAEDSYSTLSFANLNEPFNNVMGIKAILIEANRIIEDTVFKKKFINPNIAERMEREGRIGFESGRP